jgi:hypothetical protein
LDSVVLAILCLVTLGYYAAARPGMKRSGIYLPDFFLAGIASYALGAGVIYATEGGESAHAVTMMAQVALLSACIGLIIGSKMLRARYPDDYVRHNLVQWRFGRGEESAIYLGLLAGAAICAVFSAGVLLNNTLVSLLSDALSIVEPGSLLQARKAITTGSEGYFAPGIVKQFRDILIPILIGAVILIVTRQSLNSIQRVIVWGTVALALFAMILTGVRSNIFLFFIGLFVARTLAQRAYGPRKTVRRKGKSRRHLLYVLLGLVAYGTLTVLLGRTESAGGFIGLPVEIVADLFDRIVLTVPRENIGSHPLWSALNLSPGEEWLSDLRGILVKSWDPALATLLHMYLGGGSEGHSSLGLPADVWLNWGWAGLVIIPMGYGLFITYFDCRLTNLRSPVAFGIKVVLALALVKIYNPYGFILYGGMTSILLYLGLRMLRGDDRPTPRLRPVHYDLRAA